MNKICHPEFGRQAYMEVCGDGFELRVFVRRPPEAEALLDALSDECPSPYKLTPKERESSLLLRSGGDMMKLVRLQAARLDPETAEHAEGVRRKFEAAFRVACLTPVYMETVPNEYCGEDSPYGLRDPWFTVTSRIGHIKIGWRKRVINIDWSRADVDQDAEALFPNEDVTKGRGHIHAWGYEKAAAYLRRLAGVVDG